MPEAIISAKGTEAPTVRSGRFTSVCGADHHRYPPTLPCLGSSRIRGTALSSNGFVIAASLIRDCLENAHQTADFAGAQPDPADHAAVIGGQHPRADAVSAGGRPPASSSPPCSVRAWNHDRSFGISSLMHSGHCPSFQPAGSIMMFVQVEHSGSRCAGQ